MITISRADRFKDMTPEDRDALSLSADRWGRKPRLTRDEVVSLSQIKDAGFDQTTGKYNEAGLAARNTLVENNMQLVIRIAQSWVGRGVPLEDLIQEGAIGLMRAADVFDWQRGTEFSTVAGLRIVQACQRAIENQAEAIRIPVHTRSSGRCAPEVARAKRVISGDENRIGGKAATRKADAATTLFDIIPDHNANTADEALALVSADEAAGAIATALLCLNPQERAVVEARWLSGSPEPARLGAVGKQLGISKQRVEQVQKVAFAKLAAALEGVNDAN